MYNAPHPSYIVSFNNICTQELIECKRAMGEVIEMSSQAYESRYMYVCPSDLVSQVLCIVIYFLINDENASV